MTEPRDRSRFRLSPAAAFAIIAAWLLLLLVTHRGERSPYTYISELTIGESPRSDLGRIVAPDSLSVVAVTRFFYDGTPPADYSRAHNLWLPLHSFAASITIGFVRDYLWANHLTNVLFLLLLAAAVLRFGARRGMRTEALLLALLTLYSLPPVVSCIAQPLHYIVGPAISFLVILTAVALDPDDLRNPWIAGALTAVLTFSYDWYVYAVALIAYLAIVQFRRRRDDLLYLLVAAGPIVLWEIFLRRLTAGGVSTTIRNALVLPPFFEWADFLAHPLDRVLMPLITTHLGIVIAFREITAIIHWPLLAAAVWALWQGRPDFRSIPGNKLIALLAVFYLLEQLFTAAFDFENTPRRAYAFFLAFGWVYCWAVDRYFARRRWVLLFAGLFALSAFYTFADVALNRGGGAFLYVGEAVRGEAKEALLYETREIPPRMANPIEEQAPVRGSFPPAGYHPTPAFAFAQLFVAFWTITLFWLIARARLMPRAAPWVVAAVWVASLAIRMA
jgi:hypothetical protein